MVDGRLRRRVQRSRVMAAFEEVHAKEPAIVAKTRKRFGEARAKKQLIAIALNKVRRGT